MRTAFEMVKKGKEKQLKDVKLIFFAKKQELVDNFNKLNKKYEQLKLDLQKELRIKDTLIFQERKKISDLQNEIKLAKLILSDQNLSKVAFKQFKDNISDINKDSILREGCTITDLLEDYQFKKKCFEVTFTQQ